MYDLKDKNTWMGKAKRTMTSLLPVAENREGQCNRCGHCCMLPNRCPFLRFDHEAKAVCTVYNLRPPNCRKYPRVEEEQVAFPCGFSFRHPDGSANPGATVVRAHSDCHEK